MKLWTHDKLATMRAYKLEGLSFAAIAHLMGMTKNGCISAWKRHVEGNPTDGYVRAALLHEMPPSVPSVAFVRGLAKNPKYRMVTQ